MLPVGLFPPPGIVALQLDPIAGVIGEHAIRPGADRVLAAVEVLGRRHLAEAVWDDEHLREIDRQQRIDARGVQPHGQRIDDFHPADRLRVDRETAGRVRHRRHPVDGVGDVLGGEVRAVLEFYAGPQLELPGGVVHQLPRQRQRRDRVHVRIHVHQVVEDVDVERLVRPERMVVRIDAGRRGRDREREVLRGRRRGGEREGEQNSGNPQKHDRLPGISPPATRPLPPAPSHKGRGRRKHLLPLPVWEGAGGRDGQRYYLSVYSNHAAGERDPHDRRRHAADRGP